MIRNLRETDITLITRLEEVTQAVPWTEKIFRDCFFAGYPGWVLEQDKKVLGFVIIAMHGDECHLLNLCVDPYCQRQGIGSQMLRYAIDRAKQAGGMMIYLEVRETNTHAIALYKKLGFVQIGIRKDYYPAIEGREDALVYAQDLGPKI